MSSTDPQTSASWTEFQPVLEAARAGDAKALETLFEAFYPTVCRMVHRSLAADMRVKRPWIASLFSTGDVVQEVFQSVLRDLGSVRSTSKDAFAGYLAMVVRNRLVDSIRFHEAARRDGRRAAERVEAEDPISQEGGPPTQAISGEELGLFRSVLADSPQRERLLLRERIERGETFALLAERLGYPSADAARKAFYAAQARLLLALQRRGMSMGDEA